MEKRLKVVHVATHAGGGAFKAAWRLHTSLLELGIESVFLVLFKKEPAEPDLHFFMDALTWLERCKTTLRYKWIKVCNQLTFGNVAAKSPITAYRLHQHPLIQQADRVHLHYVTGFLDYASFFKHYSGPIAWTLHDRNPFEGVVHCKMEKHLPGFSSAKNRRAREIKRMALAGGKKLSIVTPSNWLREDSERSEVFSRFSHTTIRNPLSPVFRYISQETARESIGLLQQIPIVLFLADSVDDPWKGFAFFREAMKELNTTTFQVIAVGKKDIQLDVPNFTSYGYVTDEQLLNTLYASADVLVVPSLEDNFPNVVMEAHATGLPVVAFAIGGIPEMIQEGINGLLVKEVSATGLATGIRQFFDVKQGFNRSSISEQALVRYNRQAIAKHYLQVYYHLSAS